MPVALEVLNQLIDDPIDDPSDNPTDDPRKFDPNLENGIINPSFESDSEKSEKRPVKNTNAKKLRKKLEITIILCVPWSCNVGGIVNRVENYYSLRLNNLKIKK